MLNGAVRHAVRILRRTGIDEARIALGPVAERPFRPRKAEAYLQSMKISPEVILEAARIASEEAKPRTSSLRGSHEVPKTNDSTPSGKDDQELLGG